MVCSMLKLVPAPTSVARPTRMPVASACIEIEQAAAEKQVRGRAKRHRRTAVGHALAVGCRRDECSAVNARGPSRPKRS